MIVFPSLGHLAPLVALALAGAAASASPDHPERIAAARQRPLGTTVTVRGTVTVPTGADAPCTATITGVATDELGQAAAIGVTAPRACSLVVATNYVSTFRATAVVGGALRDAAVFPIDVALTGIAVRAGASLVTLTPVAYLRAWSRATSLLGITLLVAAILLLTRTRAPA